MRSDNTLRAHESGKLKVIFVTSWSENNREVFGLSLNNHCAYCNSHGYELANIEEPYNKFVDTDRIRRMFRDHDVVVSIGTDVMIQKDWPLEQFLPIPAAGMCRQIDDSAYNADLVVWYRSSLTYELLAALDDHQYEFVHGQAAMNALAETVDPQYITNMPLLQIAAPEMNPGVDYSGVNVAEYFAIHYHTMGAVPVPSDKAAAMRSRWSPSRRSP